MKSILLTSFILLALSLSSQPTIPITWSPKIGDQWKQAITNETLDPGSAGANQFWDFSEVTIATGGTLTIDWVSKSTGINSECYEGATIAADLGLEGYGSGFAYGFYGQDEGGFKAFGESTSFGTKTIYQDPQEFKFVGMQFGEIAEDTYYGATVANGFSSKAGGVTNYSYDAYGTVVLPQATFDDVVRIHQIDIARDTFILGALEEISVDTLESFAFMAQGSIFPIAIWQSSITYKESYLNGNLIGAELEDESLTFSINPDYGTSTGIKNRISANQVSVYPTSAFSQISIHSNANFKALITDFSGSFVQHIKLKPGKNVIPVSDYPNGQYIISTKEGGFLGRFFKF